MKRWRRAIGLTGIALALTLAPGSSRPAASPEQRPAAAWADWVEPDFPFFSSVLDARRAGPGFPANNLTPRGLILNLGRGYWVAFDTDLLRVAAVWRGKGVTPRALAPGSYNVPDRKTPGGQFPAPEPDGAVWLANGIYPGWQSRRAAVARGPARGRARAPRKSDAVRSRRRWGASTPSGWCPAAWCSNTPPAASPSANG